MRGPVESAGLLALDHAALRLKSALDVTTVPLARAARAFCDQSGWKPFGNARLDDHAIERFGRSGRWVRDFAELGRGLERLPGLALALTGDDGRPALGRVAVALVATVADETSLDTWIDLARRNSVRALRRLVFQARAAGSKMPVSDSDNEPAGCQGPDHEACDGAGNGGCDGAPQDRTLVRLLLPSTVKAAFEDALLLHRAVAGGETTVTSFVEALLAEAQAGPAPPDVDCAPVRRGSSAAAIEALLERVAGGWRHLGRPAREARLDGLSKQCLVELEQFSRVAGQGGPKELDRQLRGLIRLEGRIARRLGEVLACLVDRGACSRLMFRGLGHYAEERLGLGRSAAQERARVVRQLRRFPRLRAAYTDGRLALRAVAIVLRIFDRLPVEPNVERAWVAHARNVSVKRLLDEERSLKRLRLVQPTASCPLPLDDATWHASLDQRRGVIYGRVAEAGLTAAARKSWDILLRLRLPADLAGQFLATIEGRRGGLEKLADSVPWDLPWPDSLAAPSIQAARTFSIVCRRVPAWVGLLALLEDFVATWDPQQGGIRRRADAIYGRDGWRCMAPGCKVRVNLEDHHIEYRSHGGGNALTNRICLCRFHHQQGEHGLLARIRGVAPLGVTFSLGRADLARRFLNECRLDAA